MKYDPNESMFPLIGEPVRVEIRRAEEAVSAKGRDMLILHTVVCDGQPGAEWESRFYALSFHLGDILRSLGMDASGPREVDPLQLRGKVGTVLFKREPYRNDAGEEKTATKIDRWIPAGTASAPAPAPDDEPPMESYQEPPQEDETGQSYEPPDESDIPF